VNAGEVREDIDVESFSDFMNFWFQLGSSTNRSTHTSTIHSTDTKLSPQCFQPPISKIGSCEMSIRNK